MIIGITIVGFFIFTAIFAHYLAPKDPTLPDPINAMKPPSFQKPFKISLGTDRIGRDLLSRIIYGSRISLLIGLIAVSIALIIGTFFGIISGYFSGFYDMLIMRFMDVFMAFPSILLAIIIVTIMGEGLFKLMVAVGIVAIPQYSRLVRGQILVLKEQEFVQSARAIGMSHPRIIFKYILPNCLPVLIVQSTFGMATAILDAAGLSYLGLGVEAERIEWGVMLRDGQRLFLSAPWVLMYTGIAILLVVIGLNLLGDGLRDLLDPKLKRYH